MAGSLSAEGDGVRQSIFQRSISGSAVGVLAFGFTLGTNLLQVTLILGAWSQEQYGHWLLLLSAATMATALDGGHQLYVGNRLTREQVEDRLGMLVTLGSAVRMAGLLGLIQIGILSVLVFGGWIYPILGLSSDAVEGFSFGLLAYTILWIGSGSVGSVVVRLYVPAGYYVRSVVWNLVMRAVQFAVLVGAVQAGLGLASVAVLYGAVAFLLSFAIFGDLYRLLPEYWPWWQQGDVRTGFRNFIRASVYTFTGILDNLSLQGIVILVSHGLGTLAVPLFTTVRTLANMAMQGGSFLLNPVAPDMIRFHVNGERRKLIGLFRVYWLAVTIFVCGGVVALMLWVEPVYHLWTRGRLSFDPVFFGWMLVAVLLRSLALPFGTLLQLLNRLRVQAIISGARGAICLGGAWALIGPTGLAGVAAALAVGELIASLLIPAFLVLRELKGVAIRELGLFWPGLAALWACALIGISQLGGIPRNLLFLVALVGLSVSTWQQWKHIDPLLRARFVSLFPGPFRRLLAP
jgi:O-antigen/teichoic acid export membrane protein